MVPLERLERTVSTALEPAVPRAASSERAPDPGPPPAGVRHVPRDLCDARALHGRLNAALAELGLAGALAPRWATPARSGLFFAPHNLHQAYRLVLALERLIGFVAEAGVDLPDGGGSDPGPGQLSLPLGV